GDFKAAFWVAVVPAFVSVTLLVLGVHEPDRRTIGDGSDTQKQLHLRDAKRLGRGFAVVVTIAAVLTLARFSEAFLVLRARDVGLALSAAPWVMVVMSVVYAGVAYPAGAAADRGHGPRLLSAGLVVLVISDVILANAAGGVGVMLGAALWGLHMGLTQGLLAALVGGVAPADLRGTAFGVFNLVCGVGLPPPRGAARGALGGLGGGARGARGTRRLARHGVRRVQSRLWRGAPRRQRARRVALGRLWRAVHVLRRRHVHRHRVDRIPRLRPRRVGSAPFVRYIVR